MTCTSVKTTSFDSTKIKNKKTSDFARFYFYRKILQIVRNFNLLLTIALYDISIISLSCFCFYGLSLGDLPRLFPFVLFSLRESETLIENRLSQRHIANATERLFAKFTFFVLYTPNMRRDTQMRQNRCRD